MTWRPDVPYNALPALPPLGLELEPKPVLKATIEARAALTTVAQAGLRLPNPEVLISAVPLLEAQASSEIENIVTTADELFKHAQVGGGDHATKEALRYRSALFAGLDDIRDRPDGRDGEPHLLRPPRAGDDGPGPARHPHRQSDDGHGALFTPRRAGPAAPETWRVGVLHPP